MISSSFLTLRLVLLPITRPMASTSSAASSQPAKGPVSIAAAASRASEPAVPSAKPPPEKPLPGDCCGSGCVRCVWDVYYEELEEYNNQIKAVSKAEEDEKPEADGSPNG